MDHQPHMPYPQSRTWMKGELVYFTHFPDLAIYEGYVKSGLSSPIPRGGFALMPIHVPRLQRTFEVRSDQLFDSFGEARVFLAMKLNEERENNIKEVTRLEKRNYQIASVLEALNSKTFAKVQEAKNGSV